MSDMKAEKIKRKTIGLHEQLWEEIECFRKKELITSEAEAVRRLIQSGLKRDQA